MVKKMVECRIYHIYIYRERVREESDSKYCRGVG